MERAVTLLNYVESCWYVQLDEENSNQAFFEQMIEMAREAKSLTNDPGLMAEADKQLLKLEQLRVVLEVQ